MHLVAAGATCSTVARIHAVAEIATFEYRVIRSQIAAQAAPDTRRIDIGTLPPEGPREGRRRVRDYDLFASGFGGIENAALIELGLDPRNIRICFPVDIPDVCPKQGPNSIAVQVWQRGQSGSEPLPPW